MRLFIGLPLSDAAQENTAAIAKAAQDVIPGRYTLKSNYHMTLAFLGDTPPERIDEVKQVVDAFAAQFCAPQLTLGALSSFGKPSNAILIRTIQSSAPLSAMHESLRASLQQHHLPFTDGPFTPHVTLARHANLTDIHQALPSMPASVFTAAHAVLYLSARDEENILRYTPQHRANFRMIP